MGLKNINNLKYISNNNNVVVNKLNIRIPQHRAPKIIYFSAKNNCIQNPNISLKLINITE